MTQYGKRPTPIRYHLDFTFWIIGYDRFDCISAVFCSLFITIAFAGEWPLESLLTTVRVELCEREAEKEDEVDNSDSDHLAVSSSNAQ